jgi:lysophospholipase L1-like esterase
MSVDAVPRSATVEIAADAATDERTQKRLKEHVTLLQSLGIAGLANLGTLRISGSVAPRPGLTLPSAAKQAAAIPVDTAYWVATAIDLAPDTTVILEQPCRKLTIIAEKVTVGADVAFTWEQPAQPVPPALPKPAKRPQAPTPGGPQGVAGAAGSDGSAGGTGARGLDAPEIEIWSVELSGAPSFVLDGQDGGVGGAGQPGGDGGDGSTGRPELYDVFGYCKSGPGNGGDGGPGGKGGGGGPGGAGGNGGRLSFYAPQSVLSASSSLLVTVDPGVGGAGGPAGTPGAGGAGGQQGYFNRCPPPPGARRTGNPGRPGALGVAGRAGESGKRYADAVGFYPITADMFRQALVWPAITNLTPNRATAGQFVTVTGLRFFPGATVIVEGVAAPTTVASDTLLTFPVPAVPGGQRAVQVKQADGTLSRGSPLYVLPVIASADQGGRVRPGTKVTLVGTGFAPGAQVRVNDQTMPHVAFVDSNHVSFTLVRPSPVAPNAAGEPVAVRLILPDGTTSNDLPVVVDTLRMLVLGDSIQWGQGLPDAQKFHALVQAAVQAKQGNIGVYKDVLAHSGATIGVGDQTILPPIHGEVPTPYPTVWQQVDAVTDQPQMIDLVLVDGGLNDVTIARVVDPAVKPEDLSALVETHCHVGMRQLLEKIAAKFPNAQIVVTGYYPIVSKASNSKLLKPLLIAFGIKATALGGRPTAALSEDLKSRIVANCRMFADESTAKLQAAVDETNAALGGLPRVFLAVPRFTEQNSALAPDSLLWGVTADSSPQDPVAANRLKLCKANRARSEQLWCSRASAGHPNARGGQEYARVITAALTLGP